jgi:hypothetical protein
MKFLKRFNELLLGPLGVLLWAVSPQLIHWLDPTAATYDAAVWQKIIFGLVVFSVSSFSAWLMLRITFPGVFRYLTEYWDKDFVNLNEDKRCEKLKLSLLLLSLYLLGLVLCMQVL